MYHGPGVRDPVTDGVSVLGRRPSTAKEVREEKDVNPDCGRRCPCHRRQPAVSPRVGLFGLIGSGNSGNDASTEAVLAYLRTAHPEVVVDAMCGGPELVRARYGIDGVPIFWYQKFEQGKTAVPAPLLKMCGKFVDTFRTARWARRHDAVIVPGAGALETTLPVHAWGFPYSLFVLSLSGRVFGTKVALVSVGADEIGKRITRWLSNSTARLACYRSYRDNFSRDTMRQRGVDTSADRVYPDLVFGVPTPPDDPGDPQLVGVGVMAYYGGNDDRQQADQIHSAYGARHGTWGHADPPDQRDRSETNAEAHGGAQARDTPGRGDSGSRPGTGSDPGTGRRSGEYSGRPADPNPQSAARRRHPAEDRSEYL